MPAIEILNARVDNGINSPIQMEPCPPMVAVIVSVWQHSNGMGIMFASNGINGTMAFVKIDDCVARTAQTARRLTCSGNQTPSWRAIF